LGSTAPNATIFRGVLTTFIQPQSTRGCGHLSGPGSQHLRTGLLWPGQSWQGGTGDSRDTSTFVANFPIGLSLPADSPCQSMVSLHITKTGFLIPTPAGVVVEKVSEYILAHTGPRELDGHSLGGCGLGFWFSFRLYYPFGKGPGQHYRCLENKKYDKFEMCKIIPNDAPCRHRVSAQRPIINLIGNIVTRCTWTLESFRL